jgi:hypothetical protein
LPSPEPRGGRHSKRCVRVPSAWQLHLTASGFKHREL